MLSSPRLTELANDREVALLIIDQQLDFQPGGALAVAGGDEIVEMISEMMKKFRISILTQDSHPARHISFASSYEGKKPFEVLTRGEVLEGKIKSVHSAETILKYLEKTPGQSQVLWPDHCVTGSKGWEFDPRLPIERAALILRKGSKQVCDSYSAFFENDGTPTGLAGYLRERQIRAVIPVGLAGDYCVYWSIQDALKEGFKVHFDPKLTRHVQFPLGSAEAALSDLKSRPSNQIEFVDL